MDSYQDFYLGIKEPHLQCLLFEIIARCPECPYRHHSQVAIVSA
jgi:hypothetical protein